MRWRLLWGVLAAYVALDVPMVRVWRSELTLWSQALRVSASSPRALRNYAKALSSVGRDADARRIFSQ